MSEMSSEQNFLDVKIMGRDYRVACTPEEHDGLLAAVELVDSKMREIAQRTRSTIAERVAVMAALNIAHEHLSAPGAAAQKEVDAAVDTSGAKRRIAHMGARIATVLAPSSSNWISSRLLTPAPPAERPPACLLRP
jgi:cell division protein ZapA